RPRGRETQPCVRGRDPVSEALSVPFAPGIELATRPGVFLSGSRSKISSTCVCPLDERWRGLRPLRSDDVESDAERTGWPALRVTHQRVAQHIERDAVLESNRRDHRTIARGSVAIGPCFATTEKNFRKRAVGKTGSRGGIFQAADFKVERERRSAVFEMAA